jgi:hypothetical protein
MSQVKWYNILMVIKLKKLQTNHEKLILEIGRVRKGDINKLELVRSSFKSLLEGISEYTLKRRPEKGKWSAMEILAHVVDHDGNSEELKKRGIKHYIDHGLSHLEEAKKALE